MISKEPHHREEEQTETIPHSIRFEVAISGYHHRKYEEFEDRYYKIEL